MLNKVCLITSSSISFFASRLRSGFPSRWRQLLVNELSAVTGAREIPGQVRVGLGLAGGPPAEAHAPGGRRRRRRHLRQQLRRGAAPEAECRSPRLCKPFRRPFSSVLPPFSTSRFQLFRIFRRTIVRLIKDPWPVEQYAFVQKILAFQIFYRIRKGGL